MLIGMVFLIILEMFYERISLNLVVLLLPVNFVSQFWLEKCLLEVALALRQLNPIHKRANSLFNGPEVLSSACDKAKLIPKNFFKNSNPDNPGISLPIFPFRTDLKLHNISVTPKLVRKVKANLDSSKASCPDFILVLVLKDCEPQLSNN